MGGPTGEVHRVDLVTGGFAEKVQEILFVPPSELAKADKTRVALVSDISHLPSTKMTIYSAEVWLPCRRNITQGPRFCPALVGTFHSTVYPENIQSFWKGLERDLHVLCRPHLGFPHPSLTKPESTTWRRSTPRRRLSRREVALQHSRAQ